MGGGCSVQLGVQVREFVLMMDTQVLLQLHSSLLGCLFCGSLFASLGGDSRGRWKENGQRKMENRACVAVCQLAHVVLVPRSCNLESFLLTIPLSPSQNPSTKH